MKLRSIFSGVLVCALLCPAALADSLSFNGTVSASETHEIYAPIGGTVDSVKVQAGQAVKAGDVLATLSTEKVYAPESGTVTGLFAEIGDSADSVSEKYGAVMYIEGESVYTISASTDNAYNKTANKFVHVGEEVYLCCYSDGSHTGTGVITKIEGTDYTVEVRSGEFLVGETVSVFRGSSNTSVNRIGRGELTRKNPSAVTGTGSIVSLAVQNGDAVEKGDLLFETLSGAYDGYYMSGSDIVAETDGVVAQINLEQGAKLEKGSVAAVIYPQGAMRVEAEISEANLSAIQTGDKVNIELIWNQDEEITYPGVITMISAVASAAQSQGAETGESGDVTYSVYVDFTPDANTRYGMSAVVATLDDEDGGMSEVSDDEEA